MKQILIVLAFLAVSFNAAFALTKAEEKEIKKEAKKLEKDGWYCSGIMSIESLLQKVKQTEAAGNQVFSGLGESNINAEIARNRAYSEALSELMKNSNSEDIQAHVKEVGSIIRNTGGKYDCRMFITAE